MNRRAVGEAKVGGRLHQPPLAPGVHPEHLHVLQQEGRELHQSCRETEAQRREQSQELNPALVIGLTHRDSSCKQVEP